MGEKVPLAIITDFCDFCRFFKSRSTGNAEIRGEEHIL